MPIPPSGLFEYMNQPSATTANSQFRRKIKTKAKSTWKRDSSRRNQS